MLLPTLYIVMLIVAMMQPCTTRMYCIVVMVMVNVIFSLLVTSISDAWYYIYAAFADLLIMTLLSHVAGRSTLARVMIVVAYVSVLLNVMGLVSWYNFQEPTLYNHAHVVLQILAIILMITIRERHDKSGMGNDRTDWLRSSIRTDRDTSKRNDVEGDKAI